MLLSVDKISDFKYVLKCSFEGKRYEDALANYPSYIQNIFRVAYENELFEKGKTPIVVNEELHGDNLYRRILEGNFSELYKDAIEEAKIPNANLEDVEIGYFSRERIVFVMTVSSNQSIGTEQNDPVAVLQKEFYQRISNVDKLVINSAEKRDEFFGGICKMYVLHINKGYRRNLLLCYQKLVYSIMMGTRYKSI